MFFDVFVIGDFVTASRLLFKRFEAKAMAAEARRRA